MPSNNALPRGKLITVRNVLPNGDIKRIRIFTGLDGDLKTFFDTVPQKNVERLKRNGNL